MFACTWLGTWIGTPAPARRCHRRRGNETPRQHGPATPPL